jgi:hypothetical protein
MKAPFPWPLRRNNHLLRGENKMNLTAPKQVTWWIAVILGALGLLGALITIPVLTTLSFWLVLVGLVLLAVATLVNGL